MKDWELVKQKKWWIEGDRVKGVRNWSGNRRNGESDRKRGAGGGVRGWGVG